MIDDFGVSARSWGFVLGGFSNIPDSDVTTNSLNSLWAWANDHVKLGGLSDIGEVSDVLGARP